MSVDGVVEVNGHKTFYREDGPKDGPLMVFVHGWPELSYSWRHQLPAMARLGFHAVAPDLRGYGQSSKPHSTAFAGTVVRGGGARWCGVVFGFAGAGGGGLLRPGGVPAASRRGAGAAPTLE